MYVEKLGAQLLKNLSYDTLLVHDSISISKANVSIISLTLNRNNESFSWKAVTVLWTSFGSKRNDSSVSRMLFMHIKE